MNVNFQFITKISSETKSDVAGFANQLGSYYNEL